MHVQQILTKHNILELKLNESLQGDDKAVSKSTCSKQRPLLQNKEKAFKCESCDYSSSLKDNMKKHIESIHKRNKPFQCEFCKQNFEGKGDMKQHITSIHVGKKSFICEFCEKSYYKSILEQSCYISA